MSNLILSLEVNKFKKAWYKLTGIRDICEPRDLRRVDEAITILHKLISKYARTIDETQFCHRNIYEEYIKYVSEDFDEVMEKAMSINTDIKRIPTPENKIKRLLGWCDKPPRAKKFILILLARYDGKIKDRSSESTLNNLLDPFSHEWWDEYFDVDTHFGEECYRLLLVDQFGRYYVGPDNKTNILVVEHGNDMSQDFVEFMKNKRARAHGVNTTYILRRLLVRNDLREHQIRFVEKFAKRNIAGYILSRQGGRIQE